MLQSIREHTQGWIAKAIIALIIVSFSLWGIHSYFVGGTSDNTVANVNGTIITKDQLRAAYERLRRQTQMQYGTSISARDEIVLKDHALQSLINTEKLKQASYHQGFRIYNKQVDNYLQSMPEFQVDGVFSSERFQEVLSSTLLSSSEILELIHTSLLIDQPKLGIILTSFSLPNETENTISLINEERQISYILVPEQFYREKSTISPEKIGQYYNEHKSDFLTPEQVNVDYVELSLKAIAEKMQVGDGLLKSFYNENINSFTLPTAWKLADITIQIPPNSSEQAIAQLKTKAYSLHQSLKSGANFEKLAKENPGIISGEKWLNLNKVPSEFQKVVANLTQVNEISDVIETRTGFSILKVNAIQDPKVQPFDEVKTKVKEMYTHQRAEEKFAELREQLADMTYEHPDTLILAAKNLDLPMKSSELFSKDKSGSDISLHKKVREAAFSNDVLNLQNNSDPIQINPETVIVLRIKSHAPSKQLTLSDVTNIINDKLKSESSLQMTKKAADDIKSKLMAGEQFTAINKQYPFKWVSTGYVGRYATKIDSAILDAAFRLPDPAKVGKSNVYQLTRLPTGYAIVAVSGVRSGLIADKKQQNVFAEHVQNSDGLVEYELYKEKIIQH